VIDRIVGVQHAPVQHLLTAGAEPPSVVINPPAARRVKKTFTYSDVNGQMRPTGVIEEELG
jgi:hypothetical protein